MLLHSAQGMDSSFRRSRARLSLIPDDSWVWRTGHMQCCIGTACSELTGDGWSVLCSYIELLY